MRGRAPEYARFDLRKNCRNTPRMVDYIHILGGLKPGYSGVLRPDDGIDPELAVFKTDEDQLAALLAKLDQLLGEGYAPGDIAILSRRAQDTCAERITSRPWRDRLSPLGSGLRGRVVCASIHAFKGLEARAVVLTDFGRFESELDRDLFYIGASRATERLKILVSDRARLAVLHAFGAVPLGKD